MNKSELEPKHLAELHELAADAGVERYRMLSRAELIEKLAGGAPGAGSKPQAVEASPEAAAPSAERPAGAPAVPSAPPAERPRRRRRRRWGRKRKGVRVHELLLPAGPGRQAIVYGESRGACTGLLREVAAELSGASDGPDPIALLIDPSPEELAEWKREAPRAELVAAGKANHADDAIAQAVARAEAGEHVVVLIDSLSRFAEDFAGTDEARELFDSGVAAAAANGSLTVVAALERSD